MADADVSEIWRYTRATWSEQQADRYVDALFDAMQDLADDKKRGRAADDIAPGLRRQRCGSHIIFYKNEPYGADIVRVLHASMNALLHIANET